MSAAAWSWDRRRECREAEDGRGDGVGEKPCLQNGRLCAQRDCSCRAARWPCPHVGRGCPGQQAGSHPQHTAGSCTAPGGGVGMGDGWAQRLPERQARLGRGGKVLGIKPSSTEASSQPGWLMGAHALVPWVSHSGVQENPGKGKSCLWKHRGSGMSGQLGPRLGLGLSTPRSSVLGPPHHSCCVQGSSHRA